MIVPPFPESHLDLLVATHVATLTTITARGYPQTSAVLYLLDTDGKLKVSVADNRQKGKNLVANPKGNLFILDPANNWRYVEIRADFDVIPDPDFAFQQRLGDKYGIPDVRANEPAGSKRLILVANPVRISTIG